MWLLDVNTLELKEFFGRNIPPYAILSHTWGSEEVSFVEMKKPKYREMAQHKAGFAKIKGCCEQAKRDNFEWAWVDSCSIDKRSSAELSEAINSMYQWYINAEICYVYLTDVPSGSEAIAMLEKSKWFTRGWTLQELLAPRKLVFFAKDWIPIGYQVHIMDLSRFQQLTISGVTSWVDLTKTLSTITDIPGDFLVGKRRVRSACVAQRMFWASRRETTRLEDRAYSLMGLFNISMPILYGEGLEKAFARLQREIVTKTTDQSILAWHSPEMISYSLLADSPDHFKASGPITQLNKSPRQNRTSFSMTNLGLRITLRIKHPGPFQAGSSTEAMLDCGIENGGMSKISLRLHFLSNDFEGHPIFVCERLQDWTFSTEEGYPMSIFLHYALNWE
jgi:hypothetical protein